MDLYTAPKDLRCRRILILMFIYRFLLEADRDGFLGADADNISKIKRDDL